MEIKVVSSSAKQTMEIAKKYAMSIQKPIVIDLIGDMGAGKTTFSKGFAEGLGVTETVTSPTFTIMNEYTSGKMPLYHFDMYRLESLEDAENLGFNEYFDMSTLKGITLVEWSEKTPGILPALHIEVKLKKIDEEKREISIGVKGWV